MGLDLGYKTARTVFYQMCNNEVVSIIDFVHGLSGEYAYVYPYIGSNYGTANDYDYDTDYYSLSYIDCDAYIDLVQGRWQPEELYPDAIISEYGKVPTERIFEAMKHYNKDYYDSNAAEIEKIFNFNQCRHKDNDGNTWWIKYAGQDHFKIDLFEYNNCKVQKVVINYEGVPINPLGGYNYYRYTINNNNFYCRVCVPLSYESEEVLDWADLYNNTDFESLVNLAKYDIITCNNSKLRSMLERLPLLHPFSINYYCSDINVNRNYELKFFNLILNSSILKLRGCDDSDMNFYMYARWNAVDVSYLIYYRYELKSLINIICRREIFKVCDSRNSFYKDLVRFVGLCFDCDFLTDLQDYAYYLGRNSEEYYKLYLPIEEIKDKFLALKNLLSEIGDLEIDYSSFSFDFSDKAIRLGINDTISTIKARLARLKLSGSLNEHEFSATIVIYIYYLLCKELGLAIDKLVKLVGTPNTDKENYIFMKNLIITNYYLHITIIKKGTKIISDMRMLGIDVDEDNLLYSFILSISKDIKEDLEKKIAECDNLQDIYLKDLLKINENGEQEGIGEEELALVEEVKLLLKKEVEDFNTKYNEE